LNHKQIAERLVKLVVTKPSISRSVLIVERDGILFVEAIASQSGAEPFVTAVAAALSRLNFLPRQAITEVFSHGQALALDANDIESMGTMATQKNCTAAYLHPIVDNNTTIAVFYQESEGSLMRLRQAIVELDTVWTFSSLLINRVVDQRRQEEQAERFRMAQ